MCQWGHLCGWRGQLHLPVPPAVCGYVGFDVCGEVRARSCGQKGWGPASVSARFLLGQPLGAQWRQLLSCLYLVLSPGRACEQLVDFCSPDLNPCQHDGQCVGTPDGPRSVLPISRAREGRSCQVSSPPPLLLPALFPHLSSGLGLSHAGLLRVSVKWGHGDGFLARQTWGHSMDG